MKVIKHLTAHKLYSELENSKYFEIEQKEHDKIIMANKNDIILSIISLEDNAKIVKVFNTTKESQTIYTNKANMFLRFCTREDILQNIKERRYEIKSHEILNFLNSDTENLEDILCLLILEIDVVNSRYNNLYQSYKIMSAIKVPEFNKNPNEFLRIMNGIELHGKDFILGEMLKNNENP